MNAHSQRSVRNLAVVALLLTAACDGASGGDSEGGGAADALAGDYAEPHLDAAPRLALSPPKVTFTDLLLGVEQSEVVTVVNAGTAPLTLDRFTLSAAESFRVVFGGAEYVSSEETRAGVALTPAVVLAPNGSTTIAVHYLPLDAESRSGVLRLHSDDPEVEWTVVHLEAQQSGPLLGVSPAQLAFGPRVVGRRAALPLQLLSRGTEPLSITDIAFTAGSSPDFSVDTTTVSANGEPVSADNPRVVAPNHVRTIDVYFTPDTLNDVDEATGEPVKDVGALVIRNDSFEGALEVPLDGWGVLRECPVAVIEVTEGAEVVPGTVLHLRGERSDAAHGQVVRWEWSVEQPTGSHGIFAPAPTFPQATFTVDVAGTYAFSLDVWDDGGRKSCELAVYEVVVVPDAAIHVEVLWSTPGDPNETGAGALPGSDLDLHLVHPAAPDDPAAPDHDGDGSPDPYFDPTWDCWSGNPTPDWGAPGGDGDDDPRLAGADADGVGPESIELNGPENGGRYRVAVHHRDDRGHSAAVATLRIHVFHILVFQQENVRLTEGDLWCAAFIDWPSGQVTLYEAPGGGGRITPDYPAPDAARP